MKVYWKIFVAAALANLMFGDHALRSAERMPGDRDVPIEAVTLHRIFREFYMGGEHFEGEETALGDARGVDCMVHQIDENGIVREFRDNGSRNEDWYGWNAEVLAPFDGVVEAVHENPVTNVPGKFGDAPASSIRFRRSDGMQVIFAHVQKFRVKVGDSVAAGQVVANVGNNGRASCPHIHVGAWKGQISYQIRWDLRSGKSQFTTP